MKTIPRIILVFVCLFACARQVFAASEAEYGKLSETYILREDGSREFHSQMELTLFTYTAIHSMYGESFIVYNPRYQELKIHRSYTRQKDGNVVRTPENAFVEVLPAQAARTPAYNHLKEMVVVHTGLEPGATICLDYSILTKPGYLPELDLCKPIEQTSPVKDYTITIEAPAGKPLFYTLLNLPVKPVASRANPNKAVWRFRDLPAASREPEASALAGDVPLLLVSTYPSAAEALGALGRQLTPAGNMPLLSLSETIVEGKETDREKCQAILGYVTDRLDYSRLSLPETGFRIRSVDDVLPSAYATEMEKVNLLAGLLNAAGIPAEIVASFPRRADIRSCGLSAMLDVFVKTAVDGQTRLLAPTGKAMSDAGRYVACKQFLSLTNPGKEVRIEAPSAAIDYQYAIAVSPAKADVRATGSIGEAFEDTEPPAASQSLKDYNGYALLQLPDAAAGLVHQPYSRYNSKRSKNLLLPYQANERYSYHIQLSEGIELSAPGFVKTIDNAVGKVVVSLKNNGRSVEFLRVLEVKKQNISPADYPDFRRLMIEWADPNNRQLLLRMEK